jgi:ribosomal protein S18 acetylase RimI-like enzyme
MVMPVIYRPARTEDLQRAGELVVHSLNELFERHRFAPMATVRPPVFSQFSLHDDPDGLWIAEEANEILGFAFSWVCGDLWFLAQLFVSPGQQGRGIGQELLKRTFEHALKAKAAVRALITPAFNRISQGLYVRHELFPRFPIYNFSVEREDLIRRLSGEALRCEPLENTPSHLDRLAKIDACALGVSRAKHHRFLLQDGASRGAMLYAHDECVGYAYVAEGHIGPLAVTRKTVLDAALRTALKLAAGGGAPQVSAFIPSPCEATLSAAIEYGMRVTVPMVLMSTRDFGNWTQYLPRNPGFM